MNMRNDRSLLNSIFDRCLQDACHYKPEQYKEDHREEERDSWEREFPFARIPIPNEQEAENEPKEITHSDSRIV